MMFTAPRITLSALLCSVTMFGVSPTLAQTADDVRCRKCVDTRDIDRRAITRSRLKNDAVNFRKLDQKVEDGIKQDRAFYVTLDGNGAEATLVTEGSLRLLARCQDSIGGKDRAEVILTSTEDGWLVAGSDVKRTAGEEVFSLTESAADGEAFYDQIDIPGGITPDGSTIGPFILVGYGINLFGHSCIVHGRTSALTGSL